MKTRQCILAVCVLSLAKAVQSTGSLPPSCSFNDYLLNGCKLDKQEKGDDYAPCSDLVTECPPNVVFVMDGSDSVSPTGYRLALESLYREIRTVTQTLANTHIGLVIFSEAIQDLPLQQRLQPEVEDLIRQIQAIQQPRRKTSLSKALSRAREMLQEYSVIESRAYNGIKSGSIIVLLTDGHTDNRQQILQEVKLAKDSGVLIISLSLENPDGQVLKAISRVVQDHTKAVNWTSLVPCPSQVLDPLQKGRKCRDLLIVVDGSDSVLSHKETVRQYLVHTALRFRLVNNAIGVNVYGTDSQIQAADTRIRRDVDKYDLAEKIRLRLVFPTSGGTGTDRAIIQSVQMLNDDIREEPAALILIIDGPTVDPQATRTAYQNARNSGYQIILIRVGTALSNEEVSLITGGDLSNVFSVNSFTDLFSVDFDGRVCDACQAQCPSNAKITSQCGCTCLDPDFVYVASNNSCVRTDRTGCTYPCPSNAYRGSGCSCVCLDGSNFNEATRTCVTQPCTQDCPTNAQRIANCGCQCWDSSLIYNSNANQCVTRPCTQECPTNSQRIANCGCQCWDSSLVYNNNINQCFTRPCTQECPTNSQRIANCGCQCWDSSLVYNNNTNQCVTRPCTQECPTNAQRIANCGCQCWDSSLVYNNNTNLCVTRPCTQECPTNAQRIANCGCQCWDFSLVYNSNTNQCETKPCTQECPTNSQRIANCGCQCWDSSLVYNNNTNQCETRPCTQECPTNAQRIANCGCQCWDFSLVYNSNTNQCETKPCTQDCPTNSQRIANCGCQCWDSNLVYNSNTNQCETKPCSQDCPTNAQRIANCGCQCWDSSLVYNSNTNQCVTKPCTQECPTSAQRIANCGCQCWDSNLVYNINTNQCETKPCTQDCPTNSQRIANCGCQCWDSNLVYNSNTNQCVTRPCTQECPTNSQRIANCGCQCWDSSLVYNNNTNQCVTRPCTQECPTNSQRIANCGCQCWDSSLVYNSNTNQCERKPCTQDCPTNAQRIANCGCQCWDSSLVYNSNTNQCVTRPCTQECPTNAQRIANCGCQCWDSNLVYDINANQCVAQPCPQVCPVTARRTNNCGCQCTDSNQVYNIVINQCVNPSCPQECPTNARRISNCGCQCEDSSQTYLNSTNQCVNTVCSRDCPSNAIRAGNCDCKCSNISQVYNVNSNLCESVLSLCTREEYPCENNQVAYKDCNGDCFCACSTGFAGTRCEIRLQAELCNECYNDNGNYHAGVDGYCALYVSCLPLDAPANNTARPTSFIPFIMSCPENTYYITRPDGWKGCDYLTNGRCAQDRCETLPASARYPDNFACQSYWQCGTTGRLQSKQCCPEGQRFDSRSAGCVIDSSCRTTCGRTNISRCNWGNEDGDACPLDINPSNPNEYFYKERPAELLHCQPSDIMNLTMCLCVLNPNPTTIVCRPAVDMNFNQPSSSIENNVPLIAVGNSVAGNFNGSQDVFLKAFAGSGFWTEYFQINLRLKLSSPVSSGRRIAVVTNADCSTRESVAITMDDRNFYFTVFQLDKGQPAEIVIPYASRADKDGWIYLTLIYRKVGTGFVFSGTVGDYTEVYRGTVSLTTYIDMRTCALHLGQGYLYDGLVGYVDDFQVWRCDPKA